MKIQLIMSALSALVASTAAPLSAIASPDQILNPVISGSISAESPFGKCISIELDRQGPKPFGKLIAFGMMIQKYEDQDSTHPVPGVAELSFVTEESPTPLKRSIHQMELVTKDPTGWKYGQDSSGYDFMYADELENVSRIQELKSEDLQFTLNLQPCADFFTNP